MPDWQTTIALTCVALAAGNIAWRAWRTLMAPQSAGCGSGCASCPTKKPNAAMSSQPFVALESLRKSRQTDEA
ncbi:MAG: hypothetical protein SGJ20_00640 [Planctomycetota bacterium]|nr:hypothetical protein [Planctomycetota bacterium]